MAKKARRISLKLDSRLISRVAEIQLAEFRPNWADQAEWFLGALTEVFQKSKLRPLPQTCPKDLKQNAYKKLELPKDLVQALEKISRTECISLVELVRQFLWVGTEYWEVLARPGVRKEVFKQFILLNLAAK